jgi:hypothetical protein
MSDRDADNRRRIAALPVTTFAVAALCWQRHECDSDSDVCGCVFRFDCTQCGAAQTIFGESMELFIGNGGKCESCHHGIREA